MFNHDPGDTVSSPSSITLPALFGIRGAVLGSGPERRREQMPSVLFCVQSCGLDARQSFSSTPSD